MKPFQILMEKMKSGGPVTIAYLGGSITHGGATHPKKGTGPSGDYDYSFYDTEKHSWRALTFAWLKENYETTPGQFRMVHAGLGATCSELGAFRYPHDVGRYKPDLLFVEYVVNDVESADSSLDPTCQRSVFRTVRSIIDQARADNPDVAILFPLSTMKDFPTDTSDKRRKVALNREHYYRAAAHYKIPLADIAKAYYEEPMPEGVDGARLFDGPEGSGNSVHPSPHGHKAFACSVTRTLQGIFETGDFAFTDEEPLPDVAAFPENPLFLWGWDVEHSDDWEKRIDPKCGIRYPIFIDRPALFATRPGAKLRVPFKGTAVTVWMQYDVAGGSLGRMEVLLDGESLGMFVAGAKMKKGEKGLRRYMRLAYDLDPEKEHVLELNVPEEQPEEAKKGIRLAIQAICIDRGEGIGNGAFGLQAGRPRPQETAFEAN